MPQVASNGIEIAYEDHGHTDDPVLLMVHGLSMPLAAWPPALIEALVAMRFRVVTFDNRDIGWSQRFDHAEIPSIIVQGFRRIVGLPVKSPYHLTDMMRDTEGLLDALNIDSAHVVGVSMGGMISQLLTIHAPQRVKSLTSIMSTTGNRKLPGPSNAVTRHLLRGPSGPSPEEGFAYSRKMWRLIGSPAYRKSDQEMDLFLQRIFDRGITVEGRARQTLAILAAASRVPELKKINTPTLVIHGEEDPLVPVACGHDTARSIPGARITTIAGMGHDLPDALIPRFTDLIARHATTVEATIDGHKAA